VIKDILPRLKKQRFSSREELIDWLTGETGQSAGELGERLSSYGLTGFSREGSK